MKRRKLNLGKQSLKALGLTVVGVATLRSAHAATTVDFEGLSHNADIPATYPGFASHVTTSGTGYSSTSGVFVTGTPNLSVTWGSGQLHQVDSYQNWDGRGTVGQLDFTQSGGNQISLTFTPDSALYGT